MRHFSTLAIAAAIVGLSASAYAELQNVEVGGSIRIRANYYTFGDGSDDLGGFEQRTRLSVKADFTDDVSAFIEVDEYSVWGDSLRSDYFTGVDFASPADVDEVDLYQAYIQADEMWGTPLRLRVGRQEISLGSEWLVGVNNASSGFWGLSFDAVRLDYIVDEFQVTALFAMLADRPGASTAAVFDNDPFADGFLNNDTFMAAFYGSYTGIEDVVIDAYYMGVWDQNAGASLAALNALEPGRLGDVLNPGFWRIFSRVGVAPFDYQDTTTIHTVGLRGAGTIGAFDFEAEVAYQFGEVDLEQERFFGLINIDSEKSYGELAANLNVGYTFDSAWTPRVGLGYAYFGGGEEENQQNFPFWNDGYQADLSFNRLFSNWEYSEFLENTAMSNVHVIIGTLDVAPTESVALSLYLAYFLSDEEPAYGAIWNWFEETDKDLGFEVGLYADYNYTEDLVFRFGFSTFFAGDGLSYDYGFPFNFLDRPAGNAIVGNGLYGVGADDDDTYHYVYVETELSF